MIDPLRLHPLSFERLVAYWLAETDAKMTLAIDEHLLACAVCGAQFDAVVALADGIRGAFDLGQVGAFVAEPFVQHLAQRGLRVRAYRVPHNGSVHCTIAPDDALLVGRFEAPLAGVTRLDAITQSSAGGEARRYADIPFDAAAGAVLMIAKVAELRRLPALQLQLQLLSAGEDGERIIGQYRLNHSPWLAQRSV